MNRLLTATAVSVLALFAIGCAGSGTNTPDVDPDPVVRVLNASPNSTALDFMLNDTQLGARVPYLGTSANFVSFEPGEYDIAVEENGNPESQAIETFTSQRNGHVLLVASGLVTPPNDELSKRLRLTPVLFDRLAPNGNKARLVIVNAYNRAAGLENHSIDLQNPGDNPTFSSRNIEYAGAAALLIDSGAQTFVARRNGTEFDITPETTFTFGAGKIYAAVVTGIEDSATTPPVIRFIELQTK